jgi:hypothetical protein
MSLAKTLQEKLADWRPDGRQTLDVAEAGRTATVTADVNDVVGCNVWEMTVGRTAAPASPIDVRAWGERVARDVKGLREPLRLLEVDAGRNVAQLRSEEPARRDENLGYYEALLHGDGSASVRRYQAPAKGDGKREQVPFAVTHEVLAEVADELADAP